MYSSIWEEPRFRCIQITSASQSRCSSGKQGCRSGVYVMPHWNITLHDKPLCLSLWSDKGQVKRWSAKCRRCKFRALGWTWSKISKKVGRPAAIYTCTESGCEANARTFSYTTDLDYVTLEAKPIVFSEDCFWFAKHRITKKSVRPVKQILTKSPFLSWGHYCTYRYFHEDTTYLCEGQKMFNNIKHRNCQNYFSFSLVEQFI
jgi:hypothetical protein